MGGWQPAHIRLELPGMKFLTEFRQALSRFAARRAARLETRHTRGAERWLRLACRVAPRFDFVHRDFAAHFRRLNDRLRALAVARDAVRRFNKSPDAWMLLGESYLAAYRFREALQAFEGVLAIEERAEAAMAAGALYAREGITRPRVRAMRARMPPARDPRLSG